MYSSIEMVNEQCCNCNMPFSMTKQFHDQRRKDHTSFYCPAGHKQYYSGQTEEEKLRLERDRLKQNQAYLENRVKRECERKEAAQRSASAYKGKVTRLKNRASKGVCPCCNRHFVNLQNHMASKHPDFVNTED